MYERFTDHARNVMRLANAEAARMGHEYIGTEHILLGLVADASGEIFSRPSDAHLSRGGGPLGYVLSWLFGPAKEAAASEWVVYPSLPAGEILKNLNVAVAPAVIRLEVEKIVQSGPDVVTMGKLLQTPRAKKVIEYAMEETRSLNRNYVGTEHLLLGLLREKEGVAAQVLRHLGVTLQDVREQARRNREGQ
jgi:ATP-dependent Clp protease ATP-binding subunit ClpC